MSKRTKKNPVSTYLVLGLIAVVAIAVVVVLVISSTTRAGTPSGEVFGPDPSIPRGLTADGLPYLGNADAPVTMRIYEDLGCPNCKNFSVDVEPSILETFVATGKVKLEIYTLAFVNDQSLPGAEAVTCALDQDQFWEYRDLLFANQGVLPFTRTNLITWAEQLDLDRTEFASCFDRAVHKDEIVQKSQRAFDVGVTGTPTSEINGVRHVGVISFERDGAPGMRQILEEAVAEAGG